MNIAKSIYLLLFVLLTACGSENRQKLTIATAANMQYAMEELTRAFTEETGVGCETVVSSSGKLTAQISEGAPFDIFISADMKYPDELYKNGLTFGKPKVCAYGRLVLWSMLDRAPPTIEVLGDQMVRHIALANSQTAPYGAAALEVLRHYNLLDSVEKKLVYGESISQVNQFVTSRAAEVGFTAKSVVMSPKVNQRGQWTEIDTEAYSPIAQGIVRIKNRNHPHPGAQQFIDFLFSDQGKQILYNFGYSDAGIEKLGN